MNGVIGDILPPAVGIAISPIPVIAAILMLLSPKARKTSLGFLVGWVLGIVLGVLVFALLSAIIPPATSTEPQPVVGVIHLALGVLLLIVVVRQWRARPKGDAAPPMPKWMTAIDSMTAARGLVLGFVLAALNPKNLLMGVAAGVSIGSAQVGLGGATVAVIVFTVLASSTVAAPVVAYLAATARITGPLDAAKEWLLANNTTVMTVLGVVLGVVQIGKGISSF
jgi:threonine/homoserine/homoserine lactone efflux protein